jgi:hypothetical protein
MIKMVIETSQLDYAIQNYFTIDATKYSLKIDSGRAYTRDNVVIAGTQPPEEVAKKRANKRAKRYYKYLVIDETNFKNTITKIKNDNPNTNFYIYTTPLSKPFLDYIFSKNELQEAYFIWIKNLVKTFGKVYFTTYYNEWSLNYMKYSKDGDHFNPKIGKLITQFVSHENYNDTSIDISKNIMLIDSGNLDECSQILKNNISKNKSSSS